VQAKNCIRTTNGQPKVNQSYLWGITSAGSGGSDIWFGTMSNTLCTAQGSLLGMSGSGYTTPDNAWACEFGSSAWDPLYGGLAAAGDLRPARIYWYNSSSGLHDVTPECLPACNSGKAGWLPNTVDPRLFATAGLRSAATLPGGLSGNPKGTPDMVVLAGPALQSAMGINLFVFNAATHAYIGSFSLPLYSDIRQFVTYQGSSGNGIYTAVGNSANNPNSSKAGGSVCSTRAFRTTRHRSTGMRSLRATTALRSRWSACCPAKGPTLLRIRAGCTPPPGRGKVAGAYQYASLVMGPVIPTSGKLPAITSAAPLWTTLWKATDYEPDPVIASLTEAARCSPTKATCTGYDARAV